MESTAPQPPPVRTESPEVWPLIIADLERGALVDPGHKDVTRGLIKKAMARDAFGREKYGTPLQVQNGREPLADAMDEALDLMAYTRQHFERLRSTAPLTRRWMRVFRAWQLHLAACAVAVLVAKEANT